MTEEVLFVDADGRKGRIAAALLASMHGDDFQARCAAVDPADEPPDLPDLDVDDVPLTGIDDVDTDGVQHVVTLDASGKADCPPVSPGTHYLHWRLEAGDADGLRIELADRISRGFGGGKTFTPVDTLPSAWEEEG